MTTTNELGWLQQEMQKQRLRDQEKRDAAWGIKPPTDVTALDPRVQQYLSEIENRKRMSADPSYQSNLGASNLAAQKGIGDQQALAGYAQAAAQMGSLRGKTASTEGVQNVADANSQRIAQNQQGISQAEAGREAARSDDMNRKTKIAEYLQSRLDKKQDSANDFANQKALVGLKNTGDIKVAEAKFDKDRTKSALAAKVYGADPMEGFVPNEKDAEKVKAARDARDAIAQGIQRIDELYKDGGTQYVGDKASDMEAIVTGIQLSLKELQNLGVLNGPDLMLLQKQIPDPSSLTENLKGLVGEDRYVTRRNSFIQSMEDKFDSGLRARGYQRNDQRLGEYQPKVDKPSNTALAAPSPAPSSPPPAGKIRVQSPDGRVGLIPSEDLKNALSEGYKEIK